MIDAQWGQMRLTVNFLKETLKHGRFGQNSLRKHPKRAFLNQILNANTQKELFLQHSLKKTLKENLFVQNDFRK